MAANEFEKSVRKIMDEFKLHPSDEVWQNVEERIRERNKKRRILFFLFSLLGLVLAGSGLYIFSNNYSNDKLENSKKQIPLSTRNSPGKNDTAKINVPLETAIGRKLVHAEPNNHKNSTQKSKTRTANSEANSSYVVKAKNHNVTNSLSGNKNRKDRSVIVDTTRRTPNISTDNSKISSANENQTIAKTETQENVASNILSDSTQIKNKENKLNESAVQTSKPKKNEKKGLNLKWGVYFSTGSSALSGDPFSFSNSSASGNYPAAQGTPGVNTVYSIEDKPGFAFKAGVVVKEDFTKRSSLSVDLNYVYYSDKIKVGVQQNSPLLLYGAYNVASYYGGSPQKDFTEHFHFIEMPIFYSWRMMQNKNHFLSLDGGISIAYLISTNALVYDTTASGVYYHNNDLITKTHFNIIPGISYHLINSKGLELAIGPQFSFDLTKAINSNFDKRNYFLYAGISARLFFEKKKK